MDEHESESGQPEQPSRVASPAPQPAQSPANSGRGTFVVAALGVVAAGALTLLLVNANSDKSDLQDNVESQQAEITQLTADLDTTTEERDDLGTRLDDAEATLTDVQSDLDAANALVDDAEAVRAGVIDFMALSMSAGNGLSESDGYCVAQALTDKLGAAELLAGTLAAAQVTDNSAFSNPSVMRFGLAVAEAAEECGVSLDAELQAGTRYGDNAALDALYDLCGAGQLDMCDQLFLESQRGSEYERFAATCGGLFPLADAPGSCVSAGGAAPVVTGSPLPPFVVSQGDEAIGLQAPTVVGSDFELAEVEIGNSGRPTAIVFLAHWCPHCQEEVPRVQEWLDAGGYEGVDIVSVATSNNPARSNFPPSTWLEGEGWTPPVVVDNASGSVHRAFGQGGFPYWVFLNADGTVAARSAGQLNIESLEAFLNLIAAGT